MKEIRRLGKPATRGNPELGKRAEDVHSTAKATEGLGHRWAVMLQNIEPFIIEVFDIWVLAPITPRGCRYMDWAEHVVWLGPSRVPHLCGHFWTPKFLRVLCPTLPR